MPQQPIAPSVGITHFDDAGSGEYELGHLRARWTLLGESAGSVTVGLRRIQINPGAWSTPAHEHGREEEIFYVLAGRGLSWQAGVTTEIRAGDCIVYLPGRGAHTLHARDPLDVLAFGTRERDEALGFPRLDLSLVGGRAVPSQPGASGGVPVQFAREAEAGPPEHAYAPGPRPANIVALDSVTPERVERARVCRERRDLGVAAGSQRTGIRHITLAPRSESAPPHCHSAEEEIFVVLDGEGLLVLDGAETPVRGGHVIVCRAGTGVAHSFRAGDERLRLLAYGARDSNDICYYPRSNKISFRGVRLIGRIDRLDYWDGED